MSEPPLCALDFLGGAAALMSLSVRNLGTRCCRYNNWARHFMHAVMQQFSSFGAIPSPGQCPTIAGCQQRSVSSRSCRPCPGICRQPLQPSRLPKIAPAAHKRVGSTLLLHPPSVSSPTAAAMLSSSSLQPMLPHRPGVAELASVGRAWADVSFRLPCGVHSARSALVAEQAGGRTSAREALSKRRARPSEQAASMRRPSRENASDSVRTSASRLKLCTRLKVRIFHSDSFPHAIPAHQRSLWRLGAPCCSSYTHARDCHCLMTSPSLTGLSAPRRSGGCFRETEMHKRQTGGAGAYVGSEEPRRSRQWWARWGCRPRPRHLGTGAPAACAPPCAWCPHARPASPSPQCPPACSTANSVTLLCRESL